MDVQTLFETYRHMVCRLALEYTGTGPDAEDVSQAVFLRAMENVHKLEPGKEKAWLCRVTVNQCRSLQRSFWKKTSVPLEDTFRPGQRKAARYGGRWGSCRENTGWCCISTILRAFPSRRSPGSSV